MDFAVDLVRMQELGKNLGTCGDNLEGALAALEEPGEGLLGTGVLDEACVEFQESWHTGLEKIRECTEKLVEGVTASAQSYATLEAVLGQAFSQLPGNQDVSQPGSPGQPAGGG